jgi:hypothetical protein
LCRGFNLIAISSGTPGSALPAQSDILHGKSNLCFVVIAILSSHASFGIAGAEKSVGDRDCQGVSNPNNAVDSNRKARGKPAAVKPMGLCL